jgi:hypothetical protein
MRSWTALGESISGGRRSVTRLFEESTFVVSKWHTETVQDLCTGQRGFGPSWEQATAGKEAPEVVSETSRYGVQSASKFSPMQILRFRATDVSSHVTSAFN